MTKVSKYPIRTADGRRARYYELLGQLDGRHADYVMKALRAKKPERVDYWHKRALINRRVRSGADSEYVEYGKETRVQRSGRRAAERRGVSYSPVRHEYPRRTIFQIQDRTGQRQFGQKAKYIFAWSVAQWGPAAIGRKWLAYRAADKAEAKAKFEATATYSPWFFSTSMSADYGQFDCEYCGRHFYHSPSRIYRGKNKVYDCCCGTCTNRLVDARQKPYFS